MDGDPTDSNCCGSVGAPLSIRLPMQQSQCLHAIKKGGEGQKTDKQ